MSPYKFLQRLFQNDYLFFDMHFFCAYVAFLTLHDISNYSNLSTSPQRFSENATTITLQHGWLRACIKYSKTFIALVVLFRFIYLQLSSGTTCVFNNVLGITQGEKIMLSQWWAICIKVFLVSKNFHNSINHLSSNSLEGSCIKVTDVRPGYPRLQDNSCHLGYYFNCLLNVTKR